MNDIVKKDEMLPVTPAAMLQTALQQGASIEQMQQLMDLQ